MRKFTPDRFGVLLGAISAASLAFAGAAIAQTADNPAPAGAVKGERHAKGPSTRAEAEQRADRMFARMDANGDGVLDKADREAMVAKHFERLDTDKNGALSLDEFKARPERPARQAGADNPGAGEHRGHGKFGKRHMGQRGHGMMGRGMMGHGTADADKDGRITAAEFKAAALTRFDKLDANKQARETRAAAGQ